MTFAHPLLLRNSGSVERFSHPTNPAIDPTLSNILNPYAPPRSNLDSPEVEPSSFEPADRGTRLGANLLDGLISGIPIFGLIWGATALMGYSLFSQVNQPPLLVSAPLGIILSCGVYLAINGYFLAKHGQSLGKRLCGIRILRQDGSHPTLWDSFVKRYVSVALLSHIPILGYLFSFINPLFIFRENRRCLHDEIAGTMVVKMPRTRAAVPPRAEEPSEDQVAARNPPRSTHLEICPYCAELTSEDTNVCRGCGRNPFSVDAATAHRLLTVEELLRKAHKLYALGLEREALELHVYATRRFSNLRSAWQGLLDAPNAEPAMREEARAELDRIQRTIYG